MPKPRSRRRNVSAATPATVPETEPEPRLLDIPRYRAAYDRCAGLIDEFLALAPEPFVRLMRGLPLSSHPGSTGEPLERTRVFQVLVATAMIFRGTNYEHVVINPDGSVCCYAANGPNGRYSELQMAALLGAPTDLCMSNGESIHHAAGLVSWSTVQKLLVAHAIPQTRWGACLGMEMLAGDRPSDGLTCFPLSVTDIHALQRACARTSSHVTDAIAPPADEHGRVVEGGNHS